MIETYVIAKNYYVFIFALQIKDEASNTSKRVYLFVRRTYDEMLKYFDKNNKEPFIKGKDSIKLLAGVASLIDIKISNIKAFLKNENKGAKKSFADDIYSFRDRQKKTIDQESFKSIKIVSLDERDDSKIWNFFPFIYLEKNNPVNNCIMVYDIIKDVFEIE